MILIDIVFGYFKILIGSIWGKESVGEIIALRSLLALKNGTRTFDFLSNEPSPKFMQPCPRA